MLPSSNTAVEAHFIKNYEKKNHSNMVSQNENDNSPGTEPKDTEYWNWTDKEFKIAVMNKFNELQENSERQFSELRNKINEQK